MLEKKLYSIYKLYKVSYYSYYEAMIDIKYNFPANNKVFKIIIAVVIFSAPIIIPIIFQAPTNNLETSNSPGSINTIGQIGDNYLDTKPSYILEQVALSSSPDDGSYTKKFLVTIAHPSDTFLLHSSYPKEVVNQPKMELVRSGNKYSGVGTVPYQTYLVTFNSRTELSTSSFSFQIKERNKSN